MNARRTLTLALTDGPRAVLVALLALLVVLCPFAAQLVASVAPTRFQEPLEERSEGESEAPVLAAAASAAPARRLVSLAPTRVRPHSTSPGTRRDPLDRGTLGELALQSRPLRC